MFTQTSTQAKLDKEILAALDKLETLRDDPDKYADLVDRIAKLHKLKIEEASNEFKTQEALHKIEAESKLKLPSTDTALVVAANIFGILWLTRYEREHVIASKALGFVMKPR